MSDTHKVYAWIDLTSEQQDEVCNFLLSNNRLFALSMWHSSEALLKSIRGSSENTDMSIGCALDFYDENICNIYVTYIGDIIDNVFLKS